MPGYRGYFLVSEAHRPPWPEIPVWDMASILASTSASWLALLLGRGQLADLLESGQIQPWRWPC
jgi:hypothetical protein